MANVGPAAERQDHGTLLSGGARPLRAAEITAISAGRRLYCAETIRADATVNTILCHTAALEPPELQALTQIGERSFGICARAGVLYQQAADLLSELREPLAATWALGPRQADIGQCGRDDPQHLGAADSRGDTKGMPGEAILDRGTTTS